MAALIVLIPITGFTLRFAIKPIAESIASMRGTQVGSEQLADLKGQMAAL
jgi:hypothetical protein